MHIWFPLLLDRVSPGFLASFPSEAPQRDREHSACRRRGFRAHKCVITHQKSCCHHPPPHPYPSVSPAGPVPDLKDVHIILLNVCFKATLEGGIPMLQMRKPRLSEDGLTEGRTAGNGGIREDALNPGQVFEEPDPSAGGSPSGPQAPPPSPQKQRCPYLHL